MEVYVAIGKGFLHLFGERGGVRFIDPLAVIERDDLMGIIFQLIQKFQNSLVDIVSLNVFLFIATPILQGALGGLFGSREEFFRMRREENVRTILTKLGIE